MSFRCMLVLWQVVHVWFNLKKSKWWFIYYFFSLLFLNMPWKKACWGSWKYMASCCIGNIIDSKIGKCDRCFHIFFKLIYLFLLRYIFYLIYHPHMIYSLFIYSVFTCHCIERMIKVINFHMFHLCCFTLLTELHWRLGYLKNVDKLLSLRAVKL